MHAVWVSTALQLLVLGLCLPLILALELCLLPFWEPNLEFERCMDLTDKIRLLWLVLLYTFFSFRYPEVSFKAQKTGSDQNKWLWRQLLWEATGQGWPHTALGWSRLGRGWITHLLRLVPSQGKEAQAAMGAQRFGFIALACPKRLLQAVAFTAEGIAVVKFKGDECGAYRHPTGKRHLFAYMGQSDHNHQCVKNNILCSIISLS